jgi:hypothetical protein
LEKFKKKILEIDFVVPGTLRVVYQKCGTPSCKCASGKKEDKHGPYTYWDRKINSISVTTSVSRGQKRFIRKGIKNRRMLKKITEQMLKIGAKSALDL